MSKDTSISWADSSVNPQAGCLGCELWNRAAGVKRCYAGLMTDRYGGRKGYPRVFEEPTLFTERFEVALKWKDLTGKERPDKPWLNGMPRVIFVADMGDAWTEGLDVDWLAPWLPRLADSPHQWLFLTKRPSRMLDFSTRHPFPKNCWPGTSVTSANTVRRLDLLRGVVGGGPRWCSFEPLLGPVDARKWLGMPHDAGPQIDRVIEWSVIGGESGNYPEPTDMGWILDLFWNCTQSGTATFLKQLGSNPVYRYPGQPEERLALKDPKGEDWSEWDENLRVRQMPKLEVTSCL